MKLILFTDMSLLMKVLSYMVLIYFPLLELHIILNVLCWDLSTYHWIRIHQIQ